MIALIIIIVVVVVLALILRASFNGLVNAVPGDLPRRRHLSTAGNQLRLDPDHNYWHSQ
jgi:hypothetical protein